MNVLSEFNQICAGGDAAGPMNADAIECAERQLGVRFPDDYVSFLREFGALSAAGVQVYGLFDGHGDGPPLWESVVDVTKKLRALGQMGTECPAFVAISDDGTGIYFFLDTSMSPQTEIWAIGPGVKKIVSSSLSGFVVAYVQGRVPY